jgi:diacylglycerol kinase (ATP)
MSQIPFRKALVIANPIAGRGRARAGALELVSGLVQLGLECELFLTAARDHARERVRQIAPDVDLVGVVGGDGTVSEVLDGLPRREVPVAILPFGTANVMSMDLGLARDAQGALGAIARGRTTPLDTARVNGKRLSFLVSGVGIDGLALRELEARRRGPITKLAYFGAVLRALRRYEPPELSVEIDDAQLDGRFGLVLASNIVHYGGFRILSRDRRIDDGLFEVYLFAQGSRAALAGYALRALFAGLPGGSCTMRRARRVRITAEHPVPAHVDGDAFGDTPVEIEVDPVQFRLVVP